MPGTLAIGLDVGSTTVKAVVVGGRVLEIGSYLPGEKC